MTIKLALSTLFLFSICMTTSAQVAPFDSAATDIYPYRVTSINKNDMQVINNGSAALYSRIDMIRRAEHTLDLEYFIFNADTAGRLVVKELVKAVNRGVKVRILVDKSLAVFVLDKYYAQILREKNIEIRYYNSAPFFRVSSVQFRNHRKLIVRDGVEAITGGRNIADEYFNLSTKFNFLDRDVWVEGEIVKPMSETFNLYWNSKIVETPKPISAPQESLNRGENADSDKASYEYQLSTYNKKLKKAHELIDENAEDDKVLDFIMSKGKELLATTNKYNCPEASFATDREGASFLQRIQSKHYNKNYRILRKEIAEWFHTKIQEEVILDSPYFLNDSNSRKIISDLLNSNKKITIFTNSLASTDAIYVSTVFNETVKFYTPNENFNAYIYKGTFSNESELISDAVKNAEWGTHSKTILFNNEAFMIGTFNIDNRSNFYNTEMALFCSGSSELTKDIKDNISKRVENSKHLGKNGLPDDGSNILENTSRTKKLLYYFLKIPAAIGQFLL